MGASAFVSGTFAKLPQGIGVSLITSTASERPQHIAEATGLLPALDVIESLSPQPLPSLSGGVLRAGVAGAGIPECIYYPPPKYTKEAKAENYQGTVVLQVTITTEGRATNISIVKDPGKGLAEKAVEAVRGWRFRPAEGPDGKPAAVICPIEVTFHLY